MKEDPYSQQLSQQASSVVMADLAPVSGSAGWSCPSNIALVKYWGKRPVQLPMNPSLSVTLEEARTTTSINYSFDPGQTDPPIGFTFEGVSAPAFEKRIRHYIQDITRYLPVLKHTSLQIESRNTFPHSSGIASSASAMGALALCLVEVAQIVAGTPLSGETLRLVSFLARLGSGSASRSIFPGFSLWGRSGDFTGSSDEYAIPYTQFHSSFGNLRDAILIVESGEKKVSSSAGHGLMESNPFARVRFSQARQNLRDIGRSLREGDWNQFIQIMEVEALTLHAMMLTSSPGYLLMQPGTVSIIRKIREFREETGIQVGFTLDAGANVHLIYPGEASEVVDGFITAELQRFCEKGRIISDGMGEGPKRL